MHSSVPATEALLFIAPLRLQLLRLQLPRAGYVIPAGVEA